MAGRSLARLGSSLPPLGAVLTGAALTAGLLCTCRFMFGPDIGVILGGPQPLREAAQARGAPSGAQRKTREDVDELRLARSGNDRRLAGSRLLGRCWKSGGRTLWLRVVFLLLAFLGPFVIGLLLKRMLEAVSFVQDDRMAAWVGTRAVPLLVKAIGLQVVIMSMQHIAVLAYPYVVSMTPHSPPCTPPGTTPSCVATMRRHSGRPSNCRLRLKAAATRWTATTGSAGTQIGCRCARRGALRGSPGRPLS